MLLLARSTFRPTHCSRTEPSPRFHGFYTGSPGPSRRCCAAAKGKSPSCISTQCAPWPVHRAAGPRRRGRRWWFSWSQGAWVFVCSICVSFSMRKIMGIIYFSHDSLFQTLINKQQTSRIYILPLSTPLYPELQSDGDHCDRIIRHVQVHGQ